MIETCWGPVYKGWKQIFSHKGLHRPPVMKVVVIIAALAFFAQGSLAQDGQEAESSQLPRRRVFPPFDPRPWPPIWPVPKPWPLPWPRPQPEIYEETDMAEDTSSPAALLVLPPWLRPWIKPAPKHIPRYSGLDVDIPDDEQRSTRQRRSVLPHQPWRPLPWPRPWPRPRPFDRPPV
ncbi:uncharacterized protein LOC144139179 [Haemaphysalis longicornis]